MNRIISVVFLTFSLQAASVGFGEEVFSSPYLSYVYKYADTMLANGRDTYGPQASELFLSALDRMKLVPLTVRPAPPSGIRREDRYERKRYSETGLIPHRGNDPKYASTQTLSMAIDCAAAAHGADGIRA